MSKMSEIDMEREEGRLLSEDFGLSIPTPPVEVAVPPRTVETVTLEIRTLQRQAQQIMLGYAVEIGRRLEEVKAILPHGQWGESLKNEVDYSQSTANNFMRIYREYGAAQQSIFGGETKSQAFANLTYTKALRLLAIPNEEEREQFIAEHDVESMSNRELDKALKEREEAQEAANAAKEEAQGLRKETVRLQEQLADQAKVYEAKLTSAGIEAQQAKEAHEKAVKKAAQLQRALSDANTSAQSAEEEHARLLQELEELRNRPAEADTAAVEEARKTAIDEMTEKVNKAKDAKKKADEKRKAAEASLAAVQKELDELKAKGPQVRELSDEERQAMTAEAVEKAKAEGAERVQALEKQLAQADPDTAAFKVLFTSWQETYIKMQETLERIKTTDNGKAEKLQGAIRAVVEGMK